MEELVLANGAKELDITVWSIVFALEVMVRDAPEGFRQAVQVARDRDHVPPEPILDQLNAASFLDAHGLMHETVRNVILSSAVGEGRDVLMRSPIAH